MENDPYFGLFPDHIDQSLAPALYSGYSFAACPFMKNYSPRPSGCVLKPLPNGNYDVPFHVLTPDYESVRPGDIFSPNIGRVARGEWRMYPLAATDEAFVWPTRGTLGSWIVNGNQRVGTADPMAQFDISRFSEAYYSGILEVTVYVDEGADGLPWASRSHFWYVGGDVGANTNPLINRDPTGLLLLAYYSSCAFAAESSGYLCNVHA
jgi:hypothetical protein